jgi:hypothetical protein
MNGHPASEADPRNSPPKRVLAFVFGLLLTLANLLLDLPAMVTSFQVQTGQHSGNSARLDWVHVDAMDEGVTVRPPHRFGRGLHVRLRRAAASESPRSPHHISAIQTSEANPSVLP